MEKDKHQRYPRLDTILMVEGFIKKHDGEYKKRRLWESLPKRMMYQTYSIILDYLLESRKISVDIEGKIGWIYYPKITKKYHSKELGRKNGTALRHQIRHQRTAGRILSIREGK